MPGPQPQPFLTCTQCHQSKPREAFYLKWKDGRSVKVRGHCKACNTAVCRAYRTNRPEKISAINASARKLRRDWVLAYLESHPCIDCGESKPILLDFDHRDRSTKLHSISQLVGGRYSLQRLEQEVAKCDVRCVRCHRLKTAKEAGWYDYLQLAS